MPNFMRGRLARGGVVAVSVIAVVSGGILVQQAVAGPAALPQHPLMHFLGLDNPAEVARIKAREVAQGATYQKALSGCLATGKLHSTCDAEVAVTSQATQSAGDTYDRLETQMYDSLAAKPAVKAVGHAWWVCMGSPAGFTNPPEMVNAMSSNAALASQRAALTARDASCEQRVVDPVFQPLLRQAEAQLVRSHPRELTALRQALLGGS